MNALDDCVFCGQPAAHAHHITGKDPWKRHLDPNLVAPLCHQHHTLVHEDLRSQDLDRPRVRDGWNYQVALGFRLARLAVFFGRLDTYQDPPFYAPLAVALRWWSEPIPEDAT
jgi:hypothetical protein